MFKCQSCKVQVEAGIRSIKQVVEYRTKMYENKVKAGKEFKMKQSQGQEIVLERLVCESCANPASLVHSEIPAKEHQVRRLVR